MPSSMSGSTESAWMSNLPICSRTACKAASRHSWARSAPTKPWASLEMASRSVSSESFIFRVFTWRISSRPASSGTPMSISRSKRPKRRRAGSSTLGRFVAAITTTFSVGLSPSIRVSSWLTMRFSTSPPALSRLGAMESTSSMTMMAGAFARASSNAARRFDSDSPDLRDMTSGPLMVLTYTPVSHATALASKVLPVPGAP
mmetsp:Transcript_24308/g.71400  ORF Transcript_24308/g.71400 Transcript_24308/m.71400 type:complete len:202 (-) Transcript_24308:984-1589(-)